MDLGDWIGAIIFLGTILIGLFSKKDKKEKEEEVNVGSTFHYTSAHSASAHSASTPPPAPARQVTPPELPAIEGARATEDIPATPMEQKQSEPATDPLGLRDKDTLRRAIILSEVLPPKF